MVYSCTPLPHPANVAGTMPLAWQGAPPMHVVYMKSDYVKPLSAVPFDLHLPAAGEGKKRAAAGDPMREGSRKG